MLVDGVLWWTTQEAREQLGVSAGLIRWWVWRSRDVGHEPDTDPALCPRCTADPDGFPHVDPPVRRGRTAGYLAEQLLCAEAYTAQSRRGGSRRVA